LLSKLQDNFRNSNLAIFVGKKVNWLDPNASTLLGMIACVIAGYLFAVQEVFIAGILILIGGFFDILDGAIARANNKSTKFGGFLDSVTDRFSDAAILLGLMWSGLLYVQEFQNIPGWFWGTLAIIGSLMVSYTRAEAEAISITAVKGGIADRFFRTIIIAFAAIMFPLICVMNYTILVIIILCFITIAQRIITTYKKLQEN
jgi:archaetidylinositol phosphate synthase